jgi:hypothetical protein
MDLKEYLHMTKERDRGMDFKGIVTILHELPANAKKDIRLLFVVPDGESMNSFERQAIYFPIGTSEEDKYMVARFAQYVYRLRR